MMKGNLNNIKAINRQLNELHTNRIWEAIHLNQVTIKIKDTPKQIRIPICPLITISLPTDEFLISY